MPLSLYRGAGLAVGLVGTLLSSATYIVLGLHPLLALWIGVSIVGFSMLLTPTEVLGPRELMVIYENALSNIARVLEALNISSKATYTSYGEDVYIYVSIPPTANPPSTPPKSLVTTVEGATVLALKSPLSKSVIEGYSDVCNAVDYVLLELLNTADSIKCVEVDDKFIVEVHKPHISTPARIEKTLGSIFAVITASIASIVTSKPVTVESDEKTEKGRRIVVRRVGG